MIIPAAGSSVSFRRWLCLFSRFSEREMAFHGTPDPVRCAATPVEALRWGTCSVVARKRALNETRPPTPLEEGIEPNHEQVFRSPLEGFCESRPEKLSVAARPIRLEVFQTPEIHPPKEGIFV